MISEAETRRKLIDNKLAAAGWNSLGNNKEIPLEGAFYITEFPTDNGPADYILVVDGAIFAIIVFCVKPGNEQA